MVSIDDRDQHSREPGDTLPGYPHRYSWGEERTELGRRQRIEICLSRPPAVAGCPEEEVTRRPGQPVDQWQQGMRINRKPTVRGSYEHATAGAHQLGRISALICSAADVLDDSVRKADVERAVGKRKGPTIRHDHVDLWKQPSKGGRIVESDGRDLTGPRVHGFEEVAGPPIRVGHPDVQNRLVGARLHGFHEHRVSPSA
ncbi:MAG TPA: hypothetical protein VIK00_00890 [Candidatus Limnocylindrales bacterium]